MKLVILVGVADFIRTAAVPRAGKTGTRLA